MQAELGTQRDRYFMSQEQEDAAMWQTIKNYQKTVQTHAALLGKIQQWGNAFNVFSGLHGNPKSLPMRKQSIEQLPNRDELLALA